MKKGIHPNYKKVIIKVGQDQFETRSTYKNDQILMDVDFRNHPVWNSDVVNVVNQADKNVSKFNQKFGGLKFNMGAAK